MGANQQIISSGGIASPYIPTPIATPSAFGDSFEGGFYTGMIWDEIATSLSSKTLATGSQTFTVPNMLITPIVYIGQAIEIRESTYPSNKFVGTVTNAAGTTLTVNVSSISGSGTISNWSIMAKFRIIVAPKASGESTTKITANEITLPVACKTLTNGLYSTTQMKNAGDSSVYPAAWWARGLSIAGKTDWYIPARDELELAWRNLKPTTTNNYTLANRFNSDENYSHHGAFDDAVIQHGTNRNSSPVGAANTTSIPAQTASTSFMSGGAEAFISTAATYYFSSTVEGSIYTWIIAFGSGAGAQGRDLSYQTYPVRAVRRSII